MQSATRKRALTLDGEYITDPMEWIYGKAESLLSDVVSRDQLANIAASEQLARMRLEEQLRTAVLSAQVASEAAEACETTKHAMEQEVQMLQSRASTAEERLVEAAQQLETVAASAEECELSRAETEQKVQELKNAAAESDALVRDAEQVAGRLEQLSGQLETELQAARADAEECKTSKEELEEGVLREAEVIEEEFNREVSRLTRKAESDVRANQTENDERRQRTTFDVMLLPFILRLPEDQRLDLYRTLTFWGGYSQDMADAITLSGIWDTGRKEASAVRL